MIQDGTFEGHGRQRAVEGRLPPGGREDDVLRELVRLVDVADFARVELGVRDQRRRRRVARFQFVERGLYLGQVGLGPSLRRIDGGFRVRHGSSFATAQPKAGEK